MNWKLSTATFLLAFFAIFSIPNSLSAQGLDFYSRIDDAGDAMAQSLTKRHLEDFSSFREFGKSCRGEAAWLDAKNIDQDLLEEISRGEFKKLQELYHESTQKSISADELAKVANCLSDTYANLKNRATNEQNTLEVASAIGIFMDGNTKNSDFDIVADIEKINEIIFTSHSKYDGTKNNASKLIDNFLKWHKPNELRADSEVRSGSGNSQNITQTGSQNNNISSGSISAQTENKFPLPWQETCTPSGYQSIAVKNLVTEDFLRDLNSALRGNKNVQNRGQDYSENLAHAQSHSGSQNWQNNENQSNEKSDFFDKLPCNGIFCITIGTNIQSKNLLVGGNNNAIETILDQHIKKTEKISWSDLSAQKMTNNSFQLPFLNIKFKNKVAGGGVFVHNTPQITKKLEEENTPAKQEAEFEKLYRCALLSAGLGSEELKNSGVTGGGFLPRNGSTTENLEKATISLNAQDEAQFNQNIDCQSVIPAQMRNRHYAGFSTQINEISAFTNAMLDIINQILDTETKLDNVPVR